MLTWGGRILTLHLNYVAGCGGWNKNLRVTQVSLAERGIAD